MKVNRSTPSKRYGRNTILNCTWLVSDCGRSSSNGVVGSTIRVSVCGILT